MFDELKSTLETADKTAGHTEIDQIAYMLGSFPQYHTVRKAAADCPRICALLPEQATAPNELFAMMRAAEWVDREDAVGSVADKIHLLLRT